MRVVTRDSKCVRFLSHGAITFLLSGIGSSLFASDDQWPFYAGDPGSKKYSPVAQVSADNLSQLGIAWVWESPDAALVKDMSLRGNTASIDNFKATPIMVDGRLLVRTGLGILLALDPATGKPLWQFQDRRYEHGQPFSYGFTTRGLSIWRGKDGGDRIIATTPDRHLVAVDAASGTLIRSFGNNGYVSLDENLRRQAQNPRYMNYSNQVPVIVGDVIVVGSVVTDAELAYLKGKSEAQIPVGDVRGYHAETGAHLWTFHTVPVPGEPGIETWGDDSSQWVGSTNVWSLMSADPDLGLVYLPVSAPTFNYYGGFRPGDNLYGQSIVALDAKTGALRWHYQTIHHPLWDYDLPAAPVLFDAQVDGARIKGLAQVSKNGFVYVLDRVTGKPIWSIPEQAVPQGDLPGEQYSKTQPHPIRPKPFAVQGFSGEVINDLTPDILAAVLEKIKPYDYGPLFTPVSTRGTILSPGIGGGANWPGAAFDPVSGYLYVAAVNNPTIRSLEAADNAYGYRMRRHSANVDGFPIVKPPWGTITAYDLKNGDLLWQVANGEGPRKHPDLVHKNLPWLGVNSKTNLLVTNTLLFAATSGKDSHEPEAAITDLKLHGVSAELASQVQLNSRARLRAFDKTTGAHLWQHPIGPSFDDGGGLMTYLFKGRQYLIVPTGGGSHPSFLVAFALPEESRQ